MSMDATALPSELLVTPQPLIGFSGLDIAKNPVHKSIWDAFNSNRKSEKVGIQFKLLPTEYAFPVSKPKRQSYEWYHPKGILKRNWMLKHLHVLPAVVVLFQDIEWNDSQWSEKQLQCASLVQSLKNSLQGRNTRLAIVLLQKAAPLPPGEDLIASERAASLTSACGISAKMLFVLPHNDHLMGYTLRLESAFLEMAQSYYGQMSKQVRVHRDQLAASHQTLRIRHQFKLGFIAEMHLDYNTALKHYTQAYTNLEEIRVVDTNCLEIKTISGFLNYKMCRLMFKLNAPRDSITQFKAHIDKYKNRIGFKELMFEHFAWLSVQYGAFAELFCEAIKNGLPALQTQHPGIYFHKAAEYIVKRKEAFIQCSSLSLSPTENPPTIPNLNSTVLYGEFFGIRAIKTGEPFAEQQIISLVQENERCFNHSAAIITLLGQAMAQFKVYKCLRFRKKLAIDMAEEYFKCGDHAKALTLFSLMLSDYRQDKWYTIFTEVLLKTLRSAYLSASVADYISCSIEILSPSIKCDQKERVIVIENLWKVFQNVPPVPQSQIAPELRMNWETSLAAFKSPVNVDLDKISDLIDCVVSFDRPQIKYDENVIVKLFIRSQTDIPLKLRSFSIILADDVHQLSTLKAINYCIFDSLNDLRKCEEENTNVDYINFDPEFKLEPNKCYKIIFTGETQQFLENVELQVSRLEIEMGSDRQFAVLRKSSNLIGNKDFKSYDRHSEFMDDILINTSCYIVPTFHLTTHNNQNMQPMLVSEYFKVISNVSNAFNISLQNVGISISVPNSLRNKVFLTNDLTSHRQKLLSHIQIDIGELETLGSTIISYYVYSLVEGNLELQQKIWYHLESSRPKINSPVATNNEDSPINNKPSISEKVPRKMSCNIRIDYIEDTRLRKMKEDVIILSCVPEFKFFGRFYTLNRQPLEKAYRGEDFLFRANIEVQAACSIDILENYFVCDHNLTQSPYSFKRKKHTNTYKNGENLEDVVMLRSNAGLIDWITQNDFQTKKDKNVIFKRNRNAKQDYKITVKNETGIFNKNLLSKIPTNTTIIGNNSSINSQSSNLTTSTLSDDGKFKIDTSELGKDDDSLGNSNTNNNAIQIKSLPKVVFNKTIDSLQATGHCRGFIKGISLPDHTQQQIQSPIFGVYCIKWRRTGCKEENESKFVVTGVDIHEPILNIYCSIEDKMFVKIPMTYKIVIKNLASKVVHLIATLSNSDNFMCSGHKQLNISIFSNTATEIVFNLYPLKAGWQILPELSLEYNTQLDPVRDDEQQQSELCQLVQRSMPKKVFILPPIRQHQSYLK